MNESDLTSANPYGTAPLETASASPTLDWQSLVVDPLSRFVQNAAQFIPDILTIICILISGWIIGLILMFLVRLFLKSAGFNKFADVVGVSKILRDSGSTSLPHHWVGTVVLWSALLVSLGMSFERLQLGVISRQLSQFTGFILAVLISLMTAAIGIILSFICSHIVATVARSVGARKPDSYANVARGSVLAFTMLACLSAIGLPVQITFAAIGLISVTLCITFVLCFGLGGAGWAGKVLEKRLPSDKK